MTDYVNFTPEKRDRLRAAYDRALREGHTVFRFEGEEYLTGYARYMLEYLDRMLA